MNLKKKIYTLFMIFALPCFIFGQAETNYKFTDIKRLATTSVKDQHRSGTCWSFSGISFIESEMIRLGKEDIPDLSEMFVVRHCYADKARKTVRLHGNLNFGPGGAFLDVMYVLKNYGIVPEDIYKGTLPNETSHIHSEMDEVLKSYVDGIVKNPNKKISQSWEKGFDGILDAYLGEYPEKFKYKTKEHTPKSFAKEVIGINPDDYVYISSFTHHPFYTSFAIEIPDNWLWGSVMNVPMTEMMQIIDNAIENGYTVAWASDVSEKGFKYGNGIAVVSSKTEKNLTDLERGKWDAMSSNEKENYLYNVNEPGPELEITQELRQTAFDNYQTTDDHGMHIIGTAKDQNNTKYYIVKNSWNTDNVYNGYLYASEAFVKYKTLSLMIHKDAIPKDIRKKLNL